MFDRSIMSRFWLVEASRLCGLTYRRPRVAMFGISGDEVVGLEACHGWELEQRGCLDVDVLMQTAHVRQSSNRHQHASERLGQRGPEPKRRIVPARPPVMAVSTAASAADVFLRTEKISVRCPASPASLSLAWHENKPIKLFHIKHLQ